jgi:hypothetical protein
MIIEYIYIIIDVVIDIKNKINEIINNEDEVIISPYINIE